MEIKTIQDVAAALAITAFAASLIWGLLKVTYHAVRFFLNTTKIVRHMYVNEIPHIERALRRICERLGIDYDDPPIPPMDI